MSYTILPYINPTYEVQDKINEAALYQASSNVFTTTQSFFGIQNDSYSNIVGALTVSGTSTLQDVNTQALTSSSVAVSGTLSVSAASVFNTVAAQLISSVGLVDCANLSVSGTSIFGGVSTFESPPVLSGASIIASSIPADSIIDKSIGDAQIALAGVGQSSVSNGYMDLSTDQYIIGNKEFAGATRFLSGITNLGASTLEEVQCTQLYASDIAVNNNVSALTFTGALNGNASTCSIASNIIVRTDNTAGSFAIPFIKTSAGNDSIFVDDVSTPFMTYNPSNGLLSTAGLTSTAIATFNNVVLPSTFTACSNVSGVLTIPINNYSLGNFTHTMTANITTIAFTGLAVGSRSVLLLSGGGTARTLNKSVSSGGITIMNSLSGNTSIGSTAVFICNIFVISPTLVSMVWSNIT